MTSIENQIYDRLKHLVDELYRKKGISSSEIREHFLNPRNFKKITGAMKDLKYIWDDSKHHIDFEQVVYDILFYRILMDRIYYEKDRGDVRDDDFNENLLNYDEYVHNINEATESESDDIKVDNMNIRDLESIIAKYEFRAEKATDSNTAKNYLDMIKKYKKVLLKKQKEFDDKMKKNVDKDGYWISKK